MVEGFPNRGGVKYQGSANYLDFWFCATKLAENGNYFIIKL